MAPIRLFGVLVTILLVSGPCLVKGQGPYPNAPCEDKFDCDPNIGTTLLQCMDEDPYKKCSCADGRVFHYNQNKCLLVATSACSSQTRPNEITPNSECDQITKTVSCETGYPQTANKKCARPLGGACISNSINECDHDIFATCKISKCQCPAGAIVEDGECKQDGVSVCVPYDPAVPGPPQMPCRQGSDCEEKVSGSGDFRCSGCPPGMVENASGNCVVAYEGPCISGEASERPCDADAFLECDPVQAKCVCQNPNQTWFDGASCKLLIGELCTDLTPPCSGDSCVTGQPCSCPADKEPDSDNHQCVSSYLGDCATDSECSAAEFLVCGVNYKCQCESNAWFDGDSCKLLLGEQCTDLTPPCPGGSCGNGLPCSCPAGKEPDLDKHTCLVSYLEDCFVDSDCSEAEFLVCNADQKCDCSYNAWRDGASCKLLLGETCSGYTPPCSGEPCVYGQPCSCPADTAPDSDMHKCVALYLGACSVDSDCSFEDFLVCNMENKCDCENNSWYNPRSQLCELLQGEYCSSESNSQPCTEFSTCNSQNHSCVCLPGYTSTLNGTCIIVDEPGEPSFGAPCEHVNDCSREDYLECGPDKTCECHFDSRFNPSSEKCELLVRSPCIPDSFAQACTQYADCTYNVNAGYICLCSEDGFVASTDKRCVHQSCGSYNRKLENFLVTEGHHKNDELEPLYGTPCDHANDCSREDYLECGPDKTCECHFDSWFNPSSERCELLVRSPCIPDSFAQACTEYSECTYNTNAGFICLCNEDGFVGSADKRCVHQSCEGHYRKLENFPMLNNRH